MICLKNLTTPQGEIQVEIFQTKESSMFQNELAKTYEKGKDGS